MPYQTIWVEPEQFLKHRGVAVFRTYKDDDVDQGIRQFDFTVNEDCTRSDPRCEERRCRHVFDVRELSTWKEPARPPCCIGEHDTPENHAAWDRYWKIEEEAIRRAIKVAIDKGELTSSGVQPPRKRKPR